MDQSQHPISEVECFESPARGDEPPHGRAHLLTHSNSLSPLTCSSPTPSSQAHELGDGSERLEVERDEEYYFEMVEPDRDAEYYLDMVEFEVENVVYMAPRVHWPFVDATPLEDLEMDVDSNTSSWPAETGTSDVRFFFRFIELCIESKVHLSFSKNHWMHMLRFATTWSLDSLREFTIICLDPWIESDLERLIIGRDFGIPGYLCIFFANIVCRPTSLTPREVELIGLTASAQLVQVREQIHRRLVPKVPVWPGLLQDVLYHIFLEESSDVPLRTWDHDPIAEIQSAQSAGVKDWLREGYRKLVIRPEGLTPAEIATLELPEDCTRSLTYAHDIYWRIVTGDGGGGLDLKLVQLILDRATAQSFSGASETEFCVNPERSLTARLVLARQHRSLEWMKPIYTQLLTQDSAMTAEEACVLGRSTFAVLARGRAALWSSNKIPPVTLLLAQCAHYLAHTPFITNLAHNDLDASLAWKHEVSHA